MRRRQQCYLIGTITFFVSLLYMVSKLDSSLPDHQKFEWKNGKLLHEKINDLQYKINILASDISFNKKTLLKVFEELQRLTPKSGGNSLNKASTIKSTRYGAINVSITDVCPATPFDISQCDVNIIDGYNKWSFEDVDGGVWKQGYDIQTNDEEWENQKLKGTLNPNLFFDDIVVDTVFVVPHSHNDPGWIKTFQQYFEQQTINIINNIVDYLTGHPKRRFIWAEMSYLSMWWLSASSERQEKCRELVKNGQLEIVTGGWVMNDEANTHYFAIIDQMIEGNEWLHKTFNVTPTSGWAIDPFGHSPVMAYLLKKMNFENMLIQRVHYHVKKQLSMSNSLEFRWRQQWDKEGRNDILCHLMPFYSYDIPHTCGPDPKICCQFDFARLPAYRITNCPWKVNPREINGENIDERSRTLLDQYRKKSKLFRTNTLLVVLGDDFRYSKSVEINGQFINYEKIFDYINNKPELNAQLQFATLTEYFQALKQDLGANNKFPSLTGDFFTYADREDHYWSGYYTTRPYYKQQDRIVESYLRSAEIIFSLARSVARKVGRLDEFEKPLFKLLTESRRSLALFQHHDGITGTAKDFVAVDYGNRLLESIQNCQKIIRSSAKALLMSSQDQFDHNIEVFSFDKVFVQHNLQAEVKLLDMSGSGHKVVLFNSLMYERSGVVRLLISRPHVVVMHGNEKMTSQVNLVWDHETSQPRTDRYELLFESRVPALGFITYIITSSDEGILSEVDLINSKERVNHEGFTINMQAQDVVIENELFEAKFDASNGMLQTITNRWNNKINQVNLQFVFYSSRKSKDTSGAYLFLPKGKAELLTTPETRPLIRVTRGPLASQVHVILPNIRHTVTLYSGMKGSKSMGLHVTNEVDIRHNFDNREIAMRIQTSIDNKNDFFSDLNGFEIHRRKNRPKLPLQANFYPMPAMAFIQDHKNRVSVLTAQPLGVASLESGQLDLILDRRLMQDDNRGLGQGIKDNVMTSQSFVIAIEEWTKWEDQELNHPSLLVHRLSWELLHPIQTLIVEDQKQKMTSEDASFVLSTPPCSLHLLNLRAIQSRDNHIDQSALILHNVGRDCKLIPQMTSPRCRVTTDDINLKTLLPLSYVETISLSLQQRGNDQKMKVKIPVMEIEAFRVTINPDVI